MCPTTGISYPEPEPNTFSFNSPYGYCPRCHGLGVVTEVNPDTLVPDPKKSLGAGGLVALGTYKPSWIFRRVEAICNKYHTGINVPIEDLPQEALHDILYGTDMPLEIKNETTGTVDFSPNFEGIIHFILHNTEDAMSSIRNWAAQFMHFKTCTECNGGRLRKESTFFRIGDKNIVELAAMDLKQLGTFINDIDLHLSQRQKTIAEEIIREIKTRLGFLLDLGIDYLSLNRGSKTLSGGEAQRIRLATQIGSKLVNVLYILDEPSIGLHQRDNQRLIDSLKSLRDMGNSVLVVEHDFDTMRAADHIVDIGPGA
jgi:excinuclease ABC subunit A